MSTITLLCIALAGVIMLLLLVIKAKVQPFVALLLVSLLVALAAGIPAGEVGKVMIAGMGCVLGSVTIIIGLGAMLGRMIEHSGGAESLANYFSRKLGDKRTIAALTLAAFFLGIPVFFDVGFIILAPIIYGFAKVAKISPLKFGLPVAGIMLTVHVAVPPHPGPVAAAGLRISPCNEFQNASVLNWFRCYPWLLFFAPPSLLVVPGPALCRYGRRHSGNHHYV